MPRLTETPDVRPFHTGTSAVSLLRRSVPLDAAVAMMTATVVAAAFVVLGLVSGASAQTSTDASSDETMLLLRTTAGDILAELYPEAAPATVAQVVALADAGGYDGMPFVRVIDGFIVQAGQVEAHRVPAASGDQLSLIENLPLEINSNFVHTRGVLSLARFEDPMSGTSSFSVLLDDFPHLDGDYSVFGRVIEGMEVADTLATIATDANDYPVSNIEIWTAATGTEAELRATDFFDTTPNEEAADWIASVPGIATGSTVSAAGGVVAASTAAGTTAALIAAAVFGIAAFLLADRLAPRFVGALGLLAALSAGFGLFVALIPSSGPIAAVIFFICLVGFFRLLSRFESVAAPATSSPPTSNATDTGVTDTEPAAMATEVSGSPDDLEAEPAQANSPS